MRIEPKGGDLEVWESCLGLKGRMERGVGKGIGLKDTIAGVCFSRWVYVKGKEAIVRPPKGGNLKGHQNMRCGI